MTVPLQLRRLHGGLQLPPAAGVRHGVRRHAQRHVQRAGRPGAGALRAQGAAAEAGTQDDAQCLHGLTRSIISQV